MAYRDDQLNAYLERIGFEGPVRADATTLDRLHRAHRFAIPFENLDIPLGRGIVLDRERLFDKLVTRRRGGYCFEQNALFFGMAETIGFEGRPLLARVWLAAEGVPPRTHTLNLVRLDGEDSIVDVGFGGSFVPPLRLAAGAQAVTADGARHRLTEDSDHGWLLERDGGDGWQRQYSFGLDRVWPGDLQAANHFTATCPGTRFTTLRIVSAATPEGYLSLIGRTLTASRMGKAETHEIADGEEYRRLLSERFGIDLTAEEIERLDLF
ncbi:arylamine N-acetyltransferase [Sphingosinicella sp. CPCC 101087]|uniref:arylamine N-acetyltransferase family protein n=1 Tax=Sphingosinicella sp. CPCC 101087 TaxID=2497754 RepID=UPI00101BED38|nr:arylamine N-acetyltransferase [Sphingosinicella sp. CPCC 101087]